MMQLHHDDRPLPGLVRLPPDRHGFVAAATVTCLALVEVVERRVMRRRLA